MRPSRSRSWYAAIASIVFIIGTNVHDLLRYAGLRRFFQSWVVNGLANIVQVVLCMLGISLAHHIGAKQSFRELGLRAPIRRALAFSFIASLPMLLAFATTSHVNPKMSVLSVGVGCVIAPFAEEVLFRGYLFRQLYRRARWGFWLSVAIPSVLFALVHVYQAEGFLELIGILAVTGLGSVVACWVFMRWQDNLWAVFGLHSLMNLWWELFAVDGTALGGWLANGARLLTVFLAIILTIHKDRIWKPLSIEAQNVTEKNLDEMTKGDGGKPLNLMLPIHYSAEAMRLDELGFRLQRLRVLIGDESG
jgi:membrane protease YdiL (CAAX protease family)